MIRAQIWKTRTVMPATNNNPTVVRPRADWMRPVDDAILETLRDHGQLPPLAFDEFEVCAVGTARNRLPVLRDHGLIELYHNIRGLYVLTETGHAYLDEELDASKLQPDDSQ